ncbi:MAG TPA: hypothetical protein VIT91_17990 [Chthoniobacterales bacterium]
MGSPYSSGKIINHANGQGSISYDDVRARAMELAIIDGRPAKDFTDADWERAAYELHGGHLPSDDDSESESAELGIGPDLVAGSLGRHVTNHRGDSNENNVGVELVQEGMEEAEHEQMLAASEELDGEDL